MIISNFHFISFSPFIKKLKDFILPSRKSGRMYICIYTEKCNTFKKNNCEQLNISSQNKKFFLTPSNP